MTHFELEFFKKIKFAFYLTFQKIRQEICIKTMYLFKNVFQYQMTNFNNVKLQLLLQCVI